MTQQDAFLKAIRKQVPQAASLIEEIAAALNISYDAAHRRVSGKSKFSLEETLALAAHFRISLDQLYVKNENVIIRKTIEIENLGDMLEYFKQSAQQIRAMVQNEDAVLFYSAKDIPLFYFMEGTILSKFKAYVWLTLLNPDDKRIAFEHFVIDQSFLEHMQVLKRSYQKVKVREIWNANALCKDLKRIIGLIEQKSNNPDGHFELYYNELILLNNNMLIESAEKLNLFVPYTLLGYFITNHPGACENVHQFFKQQIRHSKSLSQSGIKEQQLFFHRAIRKIDYYAERLNNQVDLLF